MDKGLLVGFIVEGARERGGQEQVADAGRTTLSAAAVRGLRGCTARWCHYNHYHRLEKTRELPSTFAPSGPTY